MKAEWPKGSIARNFAELEVRKRQLGRALRRDPVMGLLIRWVENMAGVHRG